MTTEVLFSVAEVLAATGGRARDIADGQILNVCIDSRAVKSGSLFVAIRGERHDGHDFAASAIGNGALAALVSQAKAKELCGLPLVVVPEALAGLADIARAARRRSEAAIIAVTGSAGKTTTKDMIAAILRRAGETHASKRSYNNQWGVPLTLANLAKTARFGVFEIGMNHPGEIEPLARLVRPHVALVTNVGAAHIGNFDNVEAIAEAKAEIFSGLEPGGVAVLNADCDHTDFLAAAAKSRGFRVTSFGFAPDADARITDYQDRQTGSCAQITLDGQRFELRLAVSGAHMMANAVAALSVARQSGVSPEASVAALARFQPPKGRGAVYRLGPKDNPVTLIDESYNANPASMRAALAVFARTAAGNGRKILVLGDMLELGERSEALHAELGADVLAAGADRVFLVGRYMAGLAGRLQGKIAVGGTAPASHEIKDELVESLACGDVVMVKGSNGVGLERVVRAISDRFGGGRMD